MKLLRVVIDRSKWDIPENRLALEGENVFYHLSGELIRQDGPGKGLQCCLGFVGRVCKIRGMMGKFTPEEVPSKKWPKGLVDKNEKDTSETIELIRANDSVLLTHSRREAKIIRLGRKAGIAFRFVGKYLKEKKS